MNYILPGYGQGIDLALFGAIEHPNGLAIKGGPISDLLIAAGGQQLTLIGVVDHLLKQSGFEQADDSVERFYVPHNARPVRTGRHSLDDTVKFKMIT